MTTSLREVAGEKGFRLFQVRKPQNRHLVDVRGVASLPPTNRIEGVLVVVPELKMEQGEVAARLRACAAEPAAIAAWSELCAQQIQPEDED